ncbi:uncharacterized protein N7477_001898 [Penicillium maclennaniae]|uniref:uncharacterized protein n=1 Tax=Penicillium maclennaniae TaxID=1343394 RepID=UPI0025405E1A|nr:uncharacterized protein N7477_001898 [Penicillium maclennaniae]KAJ5681958.1 hypothetical protein N7477_001898 [Penicillium maclennaniae]
MPASVASSMSSSMSSSVSSMSSSVSSSMTTNATRRVSHPPSPATNILLFLIAFRIVNAFVVRTFFQPDEFFQSLEPAWQVAFGHGEGKDRGAWVTWEWEHQLRSSLHPLLFAAIYKVIDLLASALNLPAATRADLLIAGPKTAQAVVSAIGDFYTWKLASRVYGTDSRGAWTALIVTVLSPWQFFCSTRTLSNCLETTLTIVALHLWPWKWSAGAVSDDKLSKSATERSRAEDPKLLWSLRQCLCLAAFACILRPTNILIWATLASVAWLRIFWLQRKVLVREVLLCGSVVLAAAAVSDRLFYGFWTFPPLRFLYFNIAQSLAVFYGRNRWDYYVTEGYPLLLTTALPFALIGLYRTLKIRAFSPVDQVQTTIRVQLATVCVVMPFLLSLIAHKEVRFIYPLLPSLHILAAPPLVQYFYPAVYSRSSRHTPQRLTLLFLLFSNLIIALYTTVYHGSGALNVLTYLRNQHDLHAAEGQDTPYSHLVGTIPEPGITAGFLMPCHSTPWRSHLVYPSINAWALSCEPPVDFSAEEKAVYRDEADQFYDDPSQFLRKHMVGGLHRIPQRPSYVSGSMSLSTPSNPTQHQWPDYLIFFSQLEPTLHNLLRASSYGECWRTHNTHWHDDWRRHGDIVVWCLDPGEQDSWRAETHRRERESLDQQFDRIVEAIKKEALGQPERTWQSFVPFLAKPSPSSAWVTWKRSAKSLFAPRSSRTWPWTTRSRWDTFLSRFRKPSPTIRSWIPSLPSSWPSWPAFLGGKSKIKRIPVRDLWS